MPIDSDSDIKSKETSIYQYVNNWGKSPLPPTLLATLVTALHFRPFQPLPMLFPPILLFSSYLNLQDLTRESAGLSAAWSGLYLLMAKRRKEKARSSASHRIKSRFGARGLTRGAAMGMAAINCVSGSWTFWVEKEADETTI